MQTFHARGAPTVQGSFCRSGGAKQKSDRQVWKVSYSSSITHNFISRKASVRRFENTHVSMNHIKLSQWCQHLLNFVRTDHDMVHSHRIQRNSSTFLALWMNDTHSPTHSLYIDYGYWRLTHWLFTLFMWDERVNIITIMLFQGWKKCLFIYMPLRMNKCRFESKQALKTVERMHEFFKIFNISNLSI